jgi:hypothetical protein
MRQSSQFLKVALFSGAALCAVGFALVPTGQARADDCLLDSNDNGVADSGTDTDGGATSGGDDTRLACGAFTIATGIGATAVGGSASVSNAYGTAVGYGASASGGGTATGQAAQAIGGYATANGAGSYANYYAAAFGASANATGANAIAIGNSDATSNYGVAHRGECKQQRRAGHRHRLGRQRQRSGLDSDRRQRGRRQCFGFRHGAEGGRDRTGSAGKWTILDGAGRL